MDMRLNVFNKYLIVQVLVIIAVTFIFKLIPDRQVAATVAGVLFVVMPLVLLIIEYRRAKFSQKIWYVGVLQFWLMFALPILGIRLLNWGVPFDQLSFMGIPGPVLHQWSSKSYLLMVIITVWCSWKLRKAQNNK
ncbi:hypothetical protein DOE51_04430 [Bdellovibrio sp. NC01]|nr:hypothetical protein DOE51_04430 [Bdellovibrio sp. NC01]